MSEMPLPDLIKSISSPRFVETPDGETPGGEYFVVPKLGRNDTPGRLNEEVKARQEHDKKQRLIELEQKAKELDVESFLEMRKQQCQGPPKVMLNEVQREKLALSIDIGMFYYYYDSYFKQQDDDMLNTPRAKLPPRKNLSESFEQPDIVR